MDLFRWDEIVYCVLELEGEVWIVVVGKYIGLKDVYKFLGEVFVYGGIVNNVCVVMEWIEVEIFEEEGVFLRLEDVYGILVLGGFG